VFNLKRSVARAAVLAGALAATLVAVTGCSGAAPSTDKVTISYAYWDPNMTAPFEAAYKQFHAENPNITVQLRQVPFANYFTKLNTQVSSKSAPDVFWLQNIQFPLYAKNGALADLSSYAKESQALDGIPANALDGYVVDGKTLALPWQSITFGLYYNKALFDAAGVKYPTEDWTWDDVKVAAKELTDPAAGTYGILAPVWNYGAFYQTMYAEGAKIITDDGTDTDFDSPAAIKGLTFWTDISQAGYSPSVSQLAENNGDYDRWFTSSKVAMFSTGSWIASTYAKALGDKLGIVGLPSGKVDTSGYATTANAVSAGSTHIDASYKWAEFLSGAEGQKILNSMAGGAAGAPVNAAANDAWLTTVGVPEAKVFVDELSKATPLPATDDTASWEGKEMVTLSPAWQGTVSTDDAAREMAAIIRKSLATQ
jgi:multiple sugar transport system substrate-binding protein